MRFFFTSVPIKAEWSLPKNPNHCSLMVRYAAVVSLMCMTVISILVVCVLMVVSVPNTSAPGFYLMAIENLLSLSMICMAISFMESAFNSLVTLIAFRISHANDAANTAAAYYAAAKKDIEESAPMQRMQCVAYMEMMGSMKEFLKLEIEKAADAKALRTKVESSVVSDACVGSSVASDAVETVAEKRATDASDGGSSVRSAALTACV